MHFFVLHYNVLICKLHHAENHQLKSVNMKKLFYLLLLSFLLAASCEKNDDNPVDKLPPATMTGENTFGCLVNGEVWLPHTGSLWNPALNVDHAQWPTGEWQLLIGATRQKENINIYDVLTINVWDPQLGENIITPISSVYIDFKGCGNYRVDTLTPHVMTITKLDAINYIASGTFYFTAINDDCQDTIRVTEGRFDAYSHL